MAHGKKLLRQLARYLGSETVESELAAVLADPAAATALPPAVRRLLEELPAFLKVVDASYAKYEENITLAERNLALSSDELIHANRSVRAMVNSLGQGFLMFDRNGICSPVYAQACLKLLGTAPAGKPITELLRLDAERAARFSALYQLAFDPDHAMSLTEIMRFAPQKLDHETGRTIAIDYRPERSDDGRLQHIVVILTDISDKVAAEAEAAASREKLESVERILQDRQGFASYVRHLRDVLDALETGHDGALAIVALQRELHTLKGGAGVFRLSSFVQALHAFESDLAAGSPLAASAEQHVPELRLLLHKLGARLQQMVGLDIDRMEQQTNIDRNTIYAFADFLADRNLPELRRCYIERVCMESLQRQLRYFDHVVQDLAERFEKSVAPIRFISSDVPITPRHYQSLLEALVHIIRNILDHGIEQPSVRTAHGKPETGTISILTMLEAAQSQPLLHIRISDDGAGIDLERLRRKLAHRDPHAAWHTRPDTDILQELFAHGISSRDTVTQYSGRGIGLPALYHEIIKLGGTATITTSAGQGTQFDLVVPYTYAL